MTTSVFFSSNNKNKYKEYKEEFAKKNIILEQINIDLTEPQNQDVEVVACYKMNDFIHKFKDAYLHKSGINACNRAKPG